MEKATVELSVGKIVSVVENQVSILIGVRDELEDIKIELQYMQSFIRDADEKRENLREVEKTRLKIVRDTGYEIVDVIDNFTYHVNRYKSWNTFYKAFYVPKALMERRTLAGAVQNIKRRLREHVEMSKRYVMDHGDGATTSSRNDTDTNSVVRSISVGESALHHRDEDLVGVEDAKRDLLDVLLNEERERSVVSVVGMGGSGKTTLVASVFRSHAVKKHFDRCHVWVTVSQTNYTIESILRSLVKEFYKVGRKEFNAQELNRMDCRELVETLVDYLQRRRYLVVLDDVWEIDDLWTKMKVALPANTFGSRIMLTTRKEDIASFSFEVRSQTHKIKLLQENEAWELFWKKAFPHSPDQCSLELELLARSFIKKCGGLPLGLATLGALLSTKRLEFEEWRRTLDYLTWELSNNPRLTVLKSILWLSFYELPYRLKQCFLCCSIFPEDYVLRKGRLIRLWIAEGFVEQDTGTMTQEEMAERYVMELVRRCMLQVFIPTDSFYVTQGFKMHDLVRELAVSVSKDEKFCTIHDGPEEVPEQERRLHRLAIQANHIEGAYKEEDMRKIRSLFVFENDTVTSFSPTLLYNLKLLKVLDLMYLPIIRLPNELMKCYNLRYLNLTGTLIEKLPSSIGNLRDLRTLDIRHTKVRVLPSGIVKLKKLRHLITYSFSFGYDEDGFLSNFKSLNGTRAPSGMCKLKSLRVLESIEAANDTIKELSCLTQLRRIDLTNVKEDDGKDLCILIERMKKIEHLSLRASSEDEVLKIDAVSSVSPLLKSLILVGKLERLPGWFSSLQCLTNLSLRWSRLSVDFLPRICTLPNLMDLQLINACEGANFPRLHFQSGFKELKGLLLNNFPQLEEIVIEKGVMPELRVMNIVHCMILRRIPNGIEHLSHLQEFYLQNVRNELVERIRNEHGEDRPMVQHVPIIIHYCEISNFLWYPESLS